MKSRHLKIVCVFFILWLAVFPATILVAENGWRYLWSIRAAIGVSVMFVGPLFAYFVVSGRLLNKYAISALIVVSIFAALKSCLILTEYGHGIVLIAILELLIIGVIWLFGVVHSLKESSNA